MREEELLEVGEEVQVLLRRHKCNSKTFCRLVVTEVHILL